MITLSSKGQLVIPAQWRKLLGLQPGDRLVMRLEADGLMLTPQASGKAGCARDLIGIANYQGPPLSLEELDPARFAEP